MYAELSKDSPQRTWLDTLVSQHLQPVEIRTNLKMLPICLCTKVLVFPLLHLTNAIYALWLAFTLAIVALAIDWNVGALSSSWGFGQILPVTLLLLPLFTLIEGFIG